ncbi:MAG: FAD-dependent monooxygenase [Candidatus Lindowbacteria bacterium]|nr:FAD-dependent monooxygenase [Candidatus Lindowbacteria bacterium]
MAIVNHKGLQIIMSLQSEYDVIVVGAGVAGLAAAVGAARNGATTLVLDRAPEVAMKVKGEVIKRENTIITEVLRRPLADSIIRGTAKRRRIFSPSCKKHMVLEPRISSLVIEYRPFVMEIAKACVEAGAEIALNTAITDITQNENGEVRGVEGLSCNKPFLLTCKALIGADGHSSLLREYAGLPAPNICSAYKVIVEGADIPDSNMLEFFLLNNPAGAIWIFPKGERNAECGLTVWEQSPEAQESDIAETWERHRKEHPILNARLKNASYVLTSVDKLVFGGVLGDFVRPGLALVGDAAGHVGAKGASGILTSISMGYVAGQYLGAYTAKEKIIAGREVMQRCMEIMKDTDAWRLLKEEEKAGTMTRDFLFKILRTNEEIDNAWDAIAEMAKDQ